MQTDRQKEILQVSMDLISEKGIQGLTIKNIASKIGTSEPAIYRHYENKIHILVSILDYFKEFSRFTICEEKNADINSIDRITHIFDKHFQEFSKNPSLVAVIFSEEIFVNETILIEKISAIMSDNEKEIVEIIEQGQRKGEIKTSSPAAMLALIVMGSLRLLVKKWQFSGHSFSLSEKGEILIQTVINMLKSEE